MSEIYTEYELEELTEQDKPDAALEACKAIIASAIDEDGCNWCDRATQWGHEDWCPIPAALAAVAESEGD